MDAIDRQLLDALQVDSSQSYAALGERVGLSVSAVNDRVRKLRDQGIIRHYGISVDPAAVGQTLVGFVWLKTDIGKGSKKLVKAATARPEVQELHHITGKYSYLVKLRVADLAQFEELLRDEIRNWPNVVEAVPHIALSTAKESTFIRCQ